ncbi:MAG TPA: TetR-like C-terminal domain-containing protein [Sphingomicrobium sp.]|nr:TetR-like C-terminal domain-containing protein [Sphingomicrobium sp.]
MRILPQSCASWPGARIAGRLSRPQAAAEFGGKSDYIRTYFQERVAQLAPMFDAAIARGELPAEVDREALFASAAGPIHFRIFIAGQTVEDAFVRSIVESVCRLYCLPGEAPNLPLSTAIP